MMKIWKAYLGKIKFKILLHVLRKEGNMLIKLYAISIFDGTVKWTDNDIAKLPKFVKDRIKKSLLDMTGDKELVDELTKETVGK